MTRYRDDHTFTTKAQEGHVQMWWYGRGRLDALQATGQQVDWEQASEIAERYRNAMEDYSTGKVNHLRSIQSFFELNYKPVAQVTG